MGKHTLENLLINALKAAGIDCSTEKYSAISTRKSMPQSVVDYGVPETHLAGHKPLLSKAEYISSRGPVHKAASISNQRRIFGQKNHNFREEFQKCEAETEAIMSAVSTSKEVKKKTNLTNKPVIKKGEHSSDDENSTISQSKIQQGKDKKKLNRRKLVLQVLFWS